MKYYISFGQAHTHRYNGKTLDKDCLIVIDADNDRQANELANSFFNNKYSMIYDKQPDLKYFPKGVVNER